MFNTSCVIFPNKLNYMMWYYFRATNEPVYMQYDVVTKFCITF
jgi:hypothetical protein